MKPRAGRAIVSRIRQSIPVGDRVHIWFIASETFVENSTRRPAMPRGSDVTIASLGMRGDNRETFHGEGQA